MVKKITETTSNTFLEQLKKHGEEGLYNKIVEGWLSLPFDPSKIDYMELELVEFSDAFFSMFRRTGMNEYFIIGKIFRRAAHKVYRESLKKYKDKKPNYIKFINLVSTDTDNTDGYQSNNNRV